MDIPSSRTEILWEWVEEIGTISGIQISHFFSIALNYITDIMCSVDCLLQYKESQRTDFVVLIPESSCPHPPLIPIILIPIDCTSRLFRMIRKLESIVHTFCPWLSSIKWMIYYSYLLFLLSSLLIFITPSYHLHQLIITVISTTTTAILLMSSSFIPTVATSIHISMFVFHYCRKRKGGCSWLPTPLVLLDQRFIQLSCHLFYRIHISQQTKDNTDNTSLP